MERPPEDHGEPSQRVVNKVENFEQPQSRDSASASISWSPALQGSSPKSRVGSPRKGTRWQQSLWITSVVCPTSTFRSQPMQMKLLKQSWPLRGMLPSSRSKSRVIKLTMADLLRTSSWQPSRNLARQSLSVESMLIFKMLWQKEGSGHCMIKPGP